MPILPPLPDSEWTPHELCEFEGVLARRGADTREDHILQDHFRQRERAVDVSLLAAVARGSHDAYREMLERLMAQQGWTTIHNTVQEHLVGVCAEQTTIQGGGEEIRKLSPGTNGCVG